FFFLVAHAPAPVPPPSPTRRSPDLDSPTLPGPSAAASSPLDDTRLSRSLDEVISRRAAFLRDYQNARYARRYTGFVTRVREAEQDRKSTRLNSSHVKISYAVFCLKK